MPTGIALRDARRQLFAAAERLLSAGGPGALSSRAVTAEAGVAKGVLHRHFADFDDFLAEFVEHAVARLAVPAAELTSAAGSGTVAGNLARALDEVLDPIGLGVVGLMTSRGTLRTQLARDATDGIPLLADARMTVAEYLAAERELGRIAPDADLATVSLMVIGTIHLQLAGAPPGSRPGPDAIAATVTELLRGMYPAALDRRAEDQARSSSPSSTRAPN